MFKLTTLDLSSFNTSKVTTMYFMFSELNAVIRIYVSSSRLLCAKNGEFQKMKDGGGSAVCYCWYIWKKGYDGPTTIEWFN